VPPRQALTITNNTNKPAGDLDITNSRSSAREQRSRLVGQYFSGTLGLGTAGGKSHQSLRGVRGLGVLPQPAFGFHLQECGFGEQVTARECAHVLASTTERLRVLPGRQGLTGSIDQRHFACQL
jgi:hypothetical protein